ncbi:unnamed protein product [Acanthoscelides obtectus]|uniref:Uncharacterized protein n=1 Tax=Acanthoscelides obtectus TaxID=200917 RepID=A0A9P0P563_ACAOB|nr:unnamed protein product [Acanthoscelides obtectus]CAK1653416.1 hypothetical protein AOBTE_LOCUS18220 [Acanthoscelides obtectus]
MSHSSGSLCLICNARLLVFPDVLTRLLQIVQTAVPSSFLKYDHNLLLFRF